MRKRVWAYICGQRRPRSACASTQSDQGLHCPQTDSLNTTECMNGEKGPDDILRMRTMIWICAICTCVKDIVWLDATHLFSLFSDNHPVDINSLPRSEVKLNISTPIFTSNSLSTSNKTWKGTPARKTLPEIINKLIYGVSNTSTDTRTSLTHSHAKIVLIIAYMRSGSSFLGGMFNQYPESFYLFEPIRFIFEAIHDSKPVEYLSGRKRCSVFLRISFPSGHMTLIQRQLIVDATSWRCIDVEPTLY